MENQNLSELISELQQQNTDYEKNVQQLQQQQSKIQSEILNLDIEKRIKEHEVQVIQSKLNKFIRVIKENDQELQNMINFTQKAIGKMKKMVKNNFIEMRYTQSFGAINALFHYLDQNEQLRLQICNKWMYDTATGRSQNSFKLALDEIYFMHHKFKDQILVYNTNTNNLQKKSLTGVQLFNDEKGYKSYEFTQIKNKLYITGLEGDYKSCWMIFQNQDTNFNAIKRSPMKYQRRWHSQCNYQGRFMIVSGSCEDFEESMNKVEKYDTVNDTWSQFPNMNYGRYKHGSCCCGDSVYVICGEDQNYVLVQIETLDMSQPENGWQEIQINGQQANLWTGTLALNNTQIYLFGGVYCDIKICLLDIKNKTLDYVNYSQEGEYYVNNSRFPCVKQKSKDQIILASDDFENILGFDFKSKQIKFLKAIIE